MKRTAVEWLVEEYAKAFKIPVNSVMQEAIQQALAMEKEQIMDAWMDGMEGILHEIAAEKYYNETYSKGENRV